MKASALRAPSGGVDMTARSASDHRSAGRVLQRMVQSVLQRVTAPRWAIDLVVLALAAFLIAVIGVYGLAVVSTQMPAGRLQTAHRQVDGDHLVGRDAEEGGGFFGLCDKLLCFSEMRHRARFRPRSGGSWPSGGRRRGGSWKRSSSAGGPSDGCRKA